MRIVGGVAQFCTQPYGGGQLSAEATGLPPRGLTESVATEATLSRANVLRSHTITTDVTLPLVE